MTLFRMLRQILRCLDGSLVNVLYDVLMFRYVTVIRCSDGRQLDAIKSVKVTTMCVAKIRGERESDPPAGQWS